MQVRTVSRNQYRKDLVGLAMGYTMVAVVSAGSYLSARWDSPAVKGAEREAPASFVGSFEHTAQP